MTKTAVAAPDPGDRWGCFLAIGHGAHADGSAAVALGNHTEAHGQYAIAIGQGAQAVGDGAIAIGRLHDE